MIKKILIYIILVNTLALSAKADFIQESRIWKFFSKIGKDAVENFPDIPILKSEVEQGIIKFGSSTYVGDVKNGKAHGQGVFTFSDGTKYEGTFKRNLFHGEGTFLDKDGKFYRGKWRYNKLTKPINNKTREVFQLSKALGKSNYIEVRGPGQFSNKWFEAELTEVNTKEAELSTTLDIFDMPSVFSEDYGDEKKIKEILDRKNAEIISQNEESAKLSSNMSTAYVLTAKGKQDLKAQEEIVKATANQDPNTSVSHSSGGGGMSGGGGGGC